MEINVTQEHIDKANELLNLMSRSECCPVALAIKEVLGQEWSCGFSVAFKKHVGIIELPLHIKQFIDDFDNHKPVSPTKFTYKIVKYEDI